MEAAANAFARNRLLAALPEEERERFVAALDLVALGLKQSIAEPGKPFTHVYFPLGGVMSLVMEMQEGDVVEVATVGIEGMLGVPVLLGAEESPTRVFCQIPGDAARMKAAAFVEHLKTSPKIARLLQRYAQALTNQIAQTAACNHAHAIEQRMCRWLLMTHDRVGENDFPLTQEFLAQMLGVRRPSVTVVAGMLQQAGLVRYSRGRITIVNREGLEAASCECYRRVKAEHERLVGAPVG
jgi:CRP-like cAMP-binding protein